jgi:hypothetical protein
MGSDTAADSEGEQKGMSFKGLDFAEDDLEGKREGGWIGGVLGVLAEPGVAAEVVDVRRAEREFRTVFEPMRKVEIY